MEEIIIKSCERRTFTGEEVEEGRVGKYATILNVFQVRTDLVSDKNSSIVVDADRIMKKRDLESTIQAYG